MTELIGASVPRPDAWGKVTGATKYPADLIRAEARLADALTDQLGVLQQQLLELTGRDGLRLRARLSKWRERGPIGSPPTTMRSRKSTRCGDV